ncbi:putative Insecticidal toxin complex protein TccB2 [Puttea exsequens]|nr:putative Insecticidal toxin complex protein TccB2 [Puttea exsequens]
MANEEGTIVADPPTSQLHGAPGARPTLIPPPQQAELTRIRQLVLQRAEDAELLDMTLAEYVMLTKEAFWPKPHLDILYGTTLTEDAYRGNVGVKAVYQYDDLNYTSDADMTNLSEDVNTFGLPHVRTELLDRSGISYSELEDLLKDRIHQSEHSLM